MNVALVVLIALAAGFAVRFIKLPPLVGFLAAGFVLNSLGFRQEPGLALVADLGVTVLLFTIGLELDLRTLARREVAVTGLGHLALSTLAGASLFAVLALMGVPLLLGLGWPAFLLLGFALAFSSTVFVIKLLENRGDERSRYGAISIGILVIQDLAAVTFITMTADTPPSPWALLLLGLPFLRPVLRFFLDRAGHGELLVLLGVGLAIGAYTLFEAVGIKGDLGALLVGVLLATEERSAELLEALSPIKELLLVGFFVQIGLYGLPGPAEIIVAIALVLLLPAKTVAYTVLFHWARLRSRTTALCSTALTNYSEFALIVVAVSMSAGWISEDWLVTISLTVAGGLVMSSLVNKRSFHFADFLGHQLPKRAPEDLILEERPVSMEGVSAVVAGMGRVGVSAYERLKNDYDLKVRGVESCPDRVAALRKRGFDVIEADATDEDLWDRIHEAHDIQTVVLAMPDHGANLYALNQIEDADVEADVVVAVRHPEEAKIARANGAAEVIDLHKGAGTELADVAANFIFN